MQLATVPLAGAEGLLDAFWRTSGRARPSWVGPAPPSRVRAVLAPEELETERELCERAGAGDRTALGSPLARHGPRLYRAVLLPRLGNPALAEEALSLTYLRVIERIGKFEWQSVGIYPWLRVVALRIALDQLRARRREVLFDAADLEREVDQAERETRDAAELEAHD